MTAHYIPDTLIYKGEEYVIFDDTVLFSSYLEQHQIELPKDMWTRRGYVAKWEIRENMLFLIELLALPPKGYHETCCIQSKRTVRNVGLDYFFPHQKTVLADWYSGELMICYERKYYGEYDNTILLAFMIDKGHIVEEKYQTLKEWYMSR